MFAGDIFKPATASARSKTASLVSLVVCRSSRRSCSVHSTKPALKFIEDQSSSFFQLIHSCKNLDSFLQIHTQLLTRGIEYNDSLRTLLLNSYSSFCRSDLSLSVFISSPNPSIVLWNSMIRAYTRSGQHKEGIQFYHIMLQRGVQPDKHTFTFVLKACAGSLDLETGISIHREIERRKLQEDAYIGTTLLDMYCRLGMVEIASQVFDSMPAWDVVSWNVMIAGFSANNQPHRALDFFWKMTSAGIIPNKITILNLFPAVCELSNTMLCRSLHGFITRRLLLPAVANGLVDAYFKSRLVETACRIFNGMLESRDDVSWGTMISGFFCNDCFADALGLFDELRRANLKPNQVSVLSALSAAAETGNLEKGVEIHMYAIEKGMNFDVSVMTVLVTMYAKCGEVEKAKFYFYEMTDKDIVAWSAMISAFAQSGQPKEALSIFRRMILKGIMPSCVTIVGILPACADLSDVNAGKSIHCMAMKASISLDGSVGTAFVAMYAQCRSFNSSRNLFDKLQGKDVVTWNALINGYAQIGDADNALKMFHELHLSGVQPDRGTLAGVLSVFAFLDEVHGGESVHGLVIKRGFGADLHVKNATIDMYAKCREFKAAETIFCEAKSHVNVNIAWNTMIAGYMHNDLANEAMSTFHRMRTENISPNLVTLISIIPAAGCLSSLIYGLALHSIAIQTGFGAHVLVGNSLIDMYSKCGRLDQARKLFDLMEYRDAVSWNAMLAGYAMHGIGECAVDLFSQMKESCIRPDSVSLVSVLSACRHGGLVEEGRKIFRSMRSELCVEPNRKHYACMVDLLGRAGHFDEAREMIEAMAEKDADANVWGALLGAAKMHSHVKMGELAVEQLVKMEPQNPSHYVILANIYADRGRWNDARKMRAAMRRVGVSKSSACSWIEIKNPSFAQ